MPTRYLEPAAPFEQIEGDHELDVGIRLVETSGHVPVHMSVLARLPRAGAVVLAIDAIALHENLERDNGAARVDSARGRDSAKKLVDLAHRERALLVTGHDPLAWSELKHAPDYYE